MAEELKLRLDSADAQELIADYVKDRLDSLAEQLAVIVDVARSVFCGSVRSEMDVIRFVFQSSTSMSGQTKTPTRADLRRWREWPDVLRTIRDPLEAFGSLAVFEGEYEPHRARGSRSSHTSRIGDRSSDRRAQVAPR